MKSDKIIFRKPEEKDFDAFFKINSKTRNNLYKPSGPMNYEDAKKAFRELLNHWTENNFGAWKISEINNPEIIIGFGGVENKMYGNDLRLNLGFRIDEKYWGKGYATEIAKNAIKFAFDELHKNEVYALVRPKNKASIKVLEKCKMICYDFLDDVPNEENSLIYIIEK